MTFAPRKSRSGTRLPRNSGNFKLRPLTFICRSLSRRSGVAPEPRLHSDGAVWRSLVAAGFWHLGAPPAPAGASNRSERRAAAHKVGQQVWSKPNLTHLGLACQVWVLSGAFLGFGGGTETVDVSAARFLLRQRFGAIFSGSQALGLRIAPAEPQPQICCGARAVSRSLVAHFAVIGARLGDLPWRLPGTSPGFPGTSNSSNRRAAAHKVSSRNQI